MIVSVHRYELSEAADASDFRNAVAEAVDRGSFENVPGLVDYRIGRGTRGDRAGTFAAVWIYDSEEGWADAWGPVGDPVPKTEYPDARLVWEDVSLDPILAEDPDAIEYTSYEVFARAAPE